MWPGLLARMQTTAWNRRAAPARPFGRNSRHLGRGDFGHLRLSFRKVRLQKGQGLK